MGSDPLGIDCLVSHFVTRQITYQRTELAKNESVSGATRFRKMTVQRDSPIPSEGDEKRCPRRTLHESWRGSCPQGASDSPGFLVTQRSKPLFGELACGC